LKEVGTGAFILRGVEKKLNILEDVTRRGGGGGGQEYHLHRLRKERSKNPLFGGRSKRGYQGAVKH